MYSFALGIWPTLSYSSFQLVIAGWSFTAAADEDDDITSDNNANQTNCKGDKKKREKNLFIYRNHNL